MLDKNEKNSDINFEQVELRLKHVEDRQKESHDFFKHILTAISIVIGFVGIIITVLSISAKKDVDSAISEMWRKFEVLSNRALEQPEIAAYYDGKQVIDSVINIKEYDEFTIPMERLRIVNIGKKPTNEITVKILSEKRLAAIDQVEENVIHTGVWKIERSPNDNYQHNAIYHERFKLNPTEEWSSLTSIKPQFEDQTLREVMVKMYLYYGVEKPLEVDLKLSLPSKAKK